MNSCSKHKTSGRVGVSDSGWANRLKKKGLEESGVWKGEAYPFIIAQSSSVAESQMYNREHESDVDRGGKRYRL